MLGAQEMEHNEIQACGSSGLFCQLAEAAGRGGDTGGAVATTGSSVLGVEGQGEPQDSLGWERGCCLLPAHPPTACVLLLQSKDCLSCRSQFGRPPCPGLTVGPGGDLHCGSSQLCHFLG